MIHEGIIDTLEALQLNCKDVVYFKILNFFENHFECLNSILLD